MADRIAHFLEDAKAELLDALAYYNRRTPGAGDRLLRYGIATDGNIDIVAVAHAKRRPGYFKGRTK